MSGEYLFAGDIMTSSSDDAGILSTEIDREPKKVRPSAQET
jgi:hypothetical protein